MACCCPTYPKVAWVNALCFLPLCLLAGVGIVFLAVYPEFDAYFTPVDGVPYQGALASLIKPVANMLG